MLLIAALAFYVTGDEAASLLFLTAALVADGVSVIKAFRRRKRKLSKPITIRTRFAIGSVLAVGLTIIVFLVYYFAGGFYGQPFSHDPQDWGLFGDYFGGVLGTIFAGVSFVLIMGTLLQQEEELKKLQSQSLQQHHLASMQIIHSDIQYLLSRKILLRDKEHEFGEIIIGTAKEKPFDADAYKDLVNRLSEHVFEYATAVRSFEDTLQEDDHPIQHKTHMHRITRWANFLHTKRDILERRETDFLNVTQGIIDNIFLTRKNAAPDPTDGQ